MKKIFAFLLLGLTVAFASCGDEKTETGTDWFLTPVAEVNGTTVGLSCQTRFGEGVLENTSVGFSYAAVVDNKIGAFADVAGSAVDGTGIAWFSPMPVCRPDGFRAQGRSSKPGRTTCPTPIPNGPLSELLRRRA